MHRLARGNSVIRLRSVKGSISVFGMGIDDRLTGCVANSSDTRNVLSSEKSPSSNTNINSTPPSRA